MSSILTVVVNIAGRLMLAAIFLMSAMGNKVPNFGQTVEYMSALKVPLPNISLVGAIAFLIVGGVSVILGFKTRLGASLLGIFLVLATCYFHNFWTFARLVGVSDANDPVSEKSWFARRHADLDCKWAGTWKPRSVVRQNC
jgi:uncharacterized membrane protein YphA (DoxX/SURF4 family)